MKSVNSSKILRFMKRNAIYLILVACILAVGLSVTLMLINQSKSPAGELNNPGIVNPVPDGQEPNDQTGTVNPDDPDGTNPVQKPVTFIMPVEAPTSIAEYSETMVWCSTLGRFQSHLAIDFYAQEGAPVLAVYDGVVESVESSLLEGITITIDHGNGLKTVYNSLADGDMVSEGQSVKAGDIIGEVSVTNRQEYKDGAHLHFEVLENGVTIDPDKYLAIEEK